MTDTQVAYHPGGIPAFLMKPIGSGRTGNEAVTSTIERYLHFVEKGGL